MKHIQVLEPQSYLKKIGRPRAVSREQLLCAIRKYGTTSESELAEKLNVGRTTIWRRLQEIPQEKIDEVLKELSETELKPSQYDWQVFLKIPVIEEYEEKLRVKARVSDTHRKKMLRALWSVCKLLNRHPDHLEVDECSDLVARIRAKEIAHLNGKPYSEENHRRGIRAFCNT